MNVLVTGATGFIGRHLLERLSLEGNHVKALVRPDGDTSLLQAAGVEVARGDIRDYAAVERATANCQVLFHLAAKTEALELRKKIIEPINVQGTANVARAALRRAVERLVFCSSAGVYGRVIKNLAIDEDTNPHPDSPYGESKLQAERIVLSHHKRDGLPVVVARVSTVLGPGARSWLGFFRAIASGSFRLIGSGNNHHHLVDVSDAVQALLLCGGVKGIEGRTYVIAASEPIRLRDLARIIGEEVGGSCSLARLPAGPLHVYKLLNKLAYVCVGTRLPRADRIDFFLGDRIFDITRAREELGYFPKIHMTEAVARTYEWFLATGHLSAPKTEPKTAH